MTYCYKLPPDHLTAKIPFRGSAGRLHLPWKIFLYVHSLLLVSISVAKLNKF
jgi:hypothetical protein